MQVYSNKGLFVGNVPIDAKASCKAPKAIISHGHSDHVATNKVTQYISSPETLALIEGMGKSKGNINALKFGKKTSFEDTTVSLHNAGHILGSAQTLVEGAKIVAVTSDFKTQDSIIQKGALPLNCDILVIESTFGQPFCCSCRICFGKITRAYKSCQ